MSNSLFNLLAQAETAVTQMPGENAAQAQSKLFSEHHGSYWFPDQASTFAPAVDSLYMLIFWVSLVFFAGIVGAMLYFVLKYRHRPGHKPQKSPSHNTALEIAWSVLPGFLLIWFFVDGANGFFHMRVMPGDVEQIQVVAKQFDWTFYYPDGDSSTELHLVRNRPVQLVLESNDVLHSFFVPAFRQKQDVVPGRYTYTWVKPVKTGTFRLYCSEYCGDNHSNMKTIVVVHETAAERKAATNYDWKGNAPRDNGERLFKMQCAGCHNPTTEKKTGPGLAGIWGKDESLDNGSTVKVDDNYFRESLLVPNAKIVAGFARPSQMQNFTGKLTDEQILWLRIYIKSLSDITETIETPESPATEGGGPAPAGSSPEKADDATGDRNASNGGVEKSGGDGA
jgi:cytochrome c oxidase subunit 2